MQPPFITGDDVRARGSGDAGYGSEGETAETARGPEDQL
jgi:hypothetical protein